MKAETVPVRLADYSAPDFLVDTINLDIRLDPNATLVMARIAFRPNGPGTKPLVLAGDELTLNSIAIDGETLTPERYEATPSQLIIKEVPDGAFTVAIETEIDPTANTKLMGLYRTGAAYCTQCEAEGFRRITYFLDRPDVLAVYTTRIEADEAEAPILLANGNLVDSGSLPGTDRHFAVWRDPFPKPSYLFALVAGDLGVVTDSFTTMSGRKVELRIYCEHGKEQRCAFAMDALKRSMAWDETEFGREYDLDIFMIVAVSDFNMGAMENKGLNVFNDKYVLADPETATDSDFAHIETVIAHEYFHNWTGNRITCRDWFQLCLKEGLTVFRDQEFSADMRSRPVKRIADIRTLKARQFPEDAGPLAHPVRPEIYHEINNFYTPTVYEKGAEIVRMLKGVLGDEAFRAGIDLYFERHDGQAVTIEDFLAAFADSTGIDLEQFKLWYSQAGTPEIVASGHYEPQESTYTLTVAQNCPPTPGQPTKKPMHIPIRFGLVGPNGDDLAIGSTDGAKVDGDMIHLSEARHTITFSGVSARPVPSLFRGFSAPVRLSIDLTPDDLRFLTRHDCDPFNRWQAVQMLTIRDLTARTAAIVNQQQVNIEPDFIDALGYIANDNRLEAAFRAQILQLPSEADIAREIGQDVDPDAIAAARNQLREMIANAIGGQLAELVDGLSSDEPFSIGAEAAGRRALVNTALDLMVANGERGAIERVVSHFNDADNMTDRLAALSIMTASALDERLSALETFYERYRNDALILDKWLALEAMVPAPQTLERVKSLLNHSAFSISNPNRVRALVGTFASANQTQFNRADGAGFVFLAGFVTALDKRNPQTAARLLVNFRSWRTLEPGRRALAERSLQEIDAVPDLSADLRDIVARMLA